MDTITHGIAGRCSSISRLFSWFVVVRRTMIYS